MSSAPPIPARDDTPRGNLGTILFALRSMFVGLKVTLGKIFGETVTERYPHERPEMSAAYRSAIEMVRFADIDTHDCIACDACEIICPSNCITVSGERMPESKKKRATNFQMDFSTCSLCGLCIAVCPTETLTYSRRYDDAGYDAHWVDDLLQPFDDPPIEELAKTLVAREEAAKAAKKAAKLAEKAAKLAAKAKDQEDGADA